MTPKNIELLAQYVEACESIVSKHAALLEEYNKKIPHYMTGGGRVLGLYGYSPPDLIGDAKKKLRDYTQTMIAAGGYHETWNEMLVSQLQGLLREVKRKEDQDQHVELLRSLAETDTDEFVRRMQAANGYGPGERLESDTYQTVWREYNEKQLQKNRAEEQARAEAVLAEHMKKQAAKEQEDRIEKEAQRRIEERKFEAAVSAKMRQLMETP